MARERKIDMVILGLLSHEDLTGYDIKKRIDGAISFFWKGSFGNIYPALKDMEASGMIQKKAATEGGREKISYHITSTGKKVLKEWLKEEQVYVVYNGVNDIFHPMPSVQKKGYLLFLGNSAVEYKRYDVAQEVARLTGLELKTVSGVSSQELNRFYNEALCLLYPSVFRRKV